MSSSIKLSKLYVDMADKAVYGIGTTEDGIIMPLPALTMPLIVDCRRDEVYLRMSMEALLDIVEWINKSLK